MCLEAEMSLNASEVAVNASASLRRELNVLLFVCLLLLSLVSSFALSIRYAIIWRSHGIQSCIIRWDSCDFLDVVPCRDDIRGSSCSFDELSSIARLD